MRIKTEYGVIILWILSIFVRWEILHRPLQTHQEDINAHILVTLRNWEKDGFFSHQGNLVLTPNISGDKNLKASSLVQVLDSRGFGYYISYPPMAFYLPFAISQLTGIPISPNLLRGLSLCVHLACMLLIIHWFKQQHPSIPQPILWIGISYGFFSPGLLWFMGNIWFSDTLVILFCLLTIFRQGKTDSYIWLLLGLWTEWFAFALGLVLGIDAILQKNWKKVCILGTLAAIALGTWVYLYSIPAGFQNFIDALRFKMEQRTGMTSIADHGLTYTSITAWKYIVWYYLRHYFFILLSIIGLLWIARVPYQPLFQYKIWNQYLLAVLIHHFLLFNWTAVHDMSVVKTAPWLVFALILLLSFLPWKKFLYLFVFSSLIINCIWYYKQNQLQYFTADEMQQTYHTIQQTDTLQPVWIETEIPEPYLWYYGGRLVQKVDSKQEKPK